MTVVLFLGLDMNLVEIQHNFTLFFRMLWTHPNEIPYMLATLQVLNLLCERTHSFPWFTCFYQFCSLMDVLSIHPEHRSQHFCSWKTTQNLLFCPLSAVQNDHQQFKSSCSIFSQFEAQVFSDILFFNSSISNICQTHGATHSWT